MAIAQEYNGKLKGRLISLGMSQREIAKKAGIPEAHMSMVMHGKFNLTPQKKDRLAEILGCAVTDIF